MSDIHKPFTAYCPKWIDFLNQFVMVYEQNRKKEKKKKPFNFSKFVIKENSFEENYLFLLIFCFSMWISFSILLQNNNNVREFWSLGWCLRRNCFGHWLQLKHSLSIPLFFNTSLHFICMIYLNPTNLWTWSFSYCTYYLPSITCTWI